MQNIIHLQSEEAFKVLGNPTRLKIMQHLLTKPATISQLGELLERHPAQIRNHIRQLEKIGLIELSYIQPVKNYLEKYYRATSNAVFLNRAIFPWPSQEGQIVILGGGGPALEYLIEQVNLRIGSNVFCAIPEGSLDSLIYLRENYCQIAGCHLFDFETGDFNISYIRHLFAFKDMVVVTFGHRDQGLIVEKGNPHLISGISDVVQKHLTFVNRQLGAGTRLRLDQLLADNNINPADLVGYATEAQTHLEVGECVLQGKADAGLGLSSIAQQLGLDFIFLFNERYDLVMTKQTFDSVHIKALIKILGSKEFQNKVEKLGGYDLAHAGEVIQL
ncbi:MAG TPA: substrate-binding domain-containing protein [Leptolinea sp.]